MSYLDRYHDRADRREDGENDGDHREYEQVLSRGQLLDQDFPEQGLIRGEVGFRGLGYPVGQSGLDGRAADVS